MEPPCQFATYWFGVVVGMSIMFFMGSVALVAYAIGREIQHWGE